MQELSICFNEMSQSLVKRRTPKKVKGPGWMAVLTDVLLGLLSHSSQLWRNVVEQVCVCVCVCGCGCVCVCVGVCV